MSIAEPPSAFSSPVRVLAVDDDLVLLELLHETLTEMGFQVETASNGRQAVDMLAASSFDVVLSDISMPDMDGLQLLHTVRQHDGDLPVILMTGSPALPSAIEAVELGAFRYVAKPMHVAEIGEVVRRAARVHGMARLRRQALELTQRGDVRMGDSASLDTRFTSALRSLFVVHQPIVHWVHRRTFAYEAFVRSTEPTLGEPERLFEAAERLGRLAEIGRAIRAKAALESKALPPDALLFLNLHPRDLEDEELYSPSAPLSHIAPRVVLEITERSSLEGIRDLSVRLARLRRLGFRLAVDDLGAGYAGLSTFAHIEPEVVKLDMSLVRGLDRQPTKRTVVRSMIDLCGDLGMQVVCEGVETAGERDALDNLGCLLMQGFLLARPAAGFPAPGF